MADIPYNTGNPVGPYGSDSPKDLHDNAQTLDKLLMSEERTWPDRLGNERKTWAGIEEAAEGLPAIEAAAEAKASADRAEQAAQEAIGAAGQLAFRWWNDLSSVAGTTVGQMAQVVGDAGTHTDPVSGETVSNTGRYSWTGTAWQWLGPDVLAEKADRTAVDQLPAQIRNAFYGIREFRGVSENTPAILGLPREDGTIPVILDVTPDGKLLGDFDITKSLQAFFSGQAVFEYRGDSNKPAFIIDADRRVILGFNSDTGLLEGALPAGSAPVEYFPNTWVGNTTQTSTDISFIDEEFKSAEFEIRLSESNDLSDFIRAYATADDKGVCKFSVSGLSPNTRYYYGISPKGYTPSVTANFKTITNNNSYRFCFASCAHTNSSSQVFESIRDQSPEFFVHLGDLHYRDIITPDENLFLNAYGVVLAGQKALFAHIPTAYIYDDHDYGPNDADRTAPAREQCIDAYQRLVPHYPIHADRKIWQSFVVGRVRYVIPDCRSFSDPLSYTDDENKHKLGAEQEQWLYDELLSAKIAGQFVCIAFSIPWIANPDPTSDKWGGYTTERTRIANFIANNDLGGQCFTITGDIHLLAAYDASSGTSGDYSTGGGANMPSFNAAPMHQTTRPGWSAFPDGTYPADMTTHNLFGQIDVVDTGGQSITVTYRGLERGSSGNLSRRILLEQTLTLSEM